MVFESRPEHLAIYRRSYGRTGWVTAGTISASSVENEFQRICLAPCEVSMPAGADTLAVAQTAGGEGFPQSVGAVNLPAGRSRVTFNYKDHGTVRYTGKVVFGAGLIGGLTYLLVKAGSYSNCAGDDACKNSALDGMLLGGGIFLGTTLVGGLMMSVGDSVEVKVTRRAQYEPLLPRGRQISLRAAF